MTPEPGSTLKGTVVRVADYGALVRLPGGEIGLIHISEIADAYVRDVRDYLNEGQEVSVKVLRVNHKGRYELSIKQCGSGAGAGGDGRLVATGGACRDHPSARRPHDKPVRAGLAVSFEDRLSRYLKDSEERLHDLKRNIEAKRGRR